MFLLFSPAYSAGPFSHRQQDGPSTLRVGQVTAVAWPEQRRVALELATRANQPTTWPGLGPRTPGPLQLIIVPDGQRLDSLLHGRAPPWGAGIAVPGARTILLRADQQDLYVTLRHELAHLALHDVVRVRLPLWFDEGYATWAAGEWGRLGVLELNLAVVRGAIPDLSSLDAALRGPATSADAAYALAVSAVIELARRNPSGSLAPLLDRLAAGEDFGASVQATTGLTLSRFEEAWERSIRKRYSFATWLVAGGGWGVLALSLWALIRMRRRRDQARRAALDIGWDVEPEDAGPAELDRTSEQ
jgi:hypothetical protein